MKGHEESFPSRRMADHLCSEPDRRAAQFLTLLPALFLQILHGTYFFHSMRRFVLAPEMPVLGQSCSDPPLRPQIRKSAVRQEPVKKSGVIVLEEYPSFLHNSGLEMYIHNHNHRVSPVR